MKKDEKGGGVAIKHVKMTCNWKKEDYFSLLIAKDKKAHDALEMLVDDLHTEKDATILTFLSHSGAEDFLWGLSNLLGCDNPRLSISENGCSRILHHQNAQHILTKLVQSLGVDEAERMLSALAKMLSCNDTGASKNACFALSCLATNTEGHTRLLNNIHSDDILRTLSELLSADDSETGWFAAMTLRTLASQPRGCLRLRDHPQVIPALKSIERKTDVNADLKEEATTTLDVLKNVRRKCGSKCVYTGKENFVEINGLQPCTQYTYKLRAYTEGDESPFIPFAPENLRVLGDKMVEHTYEMCSIITGLQASTSYDVSVCASTTKGKGAHAPSKPMVQVLGRNEIHISWHPPEVPLGRITRYDVIMNNKVIYSVDSNRPPLYQPPRKESIDEERSNTPKDHGKSPGDDVREISPSHKTSPDIKKESQQHQPPPVPKTRSPGLSVHFKEPHPSSYKKPQKPEALAINHKMFPVSMSYVSIQGGDREEVMASSHPNDQDSLKRERSSMDSANSVLKMQRSRTMIHSGRTNLRTHPLNESFNNSHTRNVQDVNLTPSTVSLDTANKNKQSKTKPIINDLPIKSVKNPSPVTESDLTTVSDTNKSSEHVITSAHRSHKSSAHRSHHTNYESGDKNVKTTEKLNNHSERPKSIKETFLPKPSLPSQQYLESGGTNWGSRTLPSPRSSYEFDKSLWICLYIVYQKFEFYSISEI
ncbi:hypothetical protein KUTeg_021627 [Tegillarca granosa]|uniref:Uncharacterized protein n=1 Tax=Tegillarca granosa TaxID=220873 RepID=A0ABQ9E3V6_TEGGR|nr:hypothetical protein KUTeg_021627 [Tegillarca granosa]